MEKMQIVVLVLTVVGVQYTISWVGNCLMDMCSGQIKYAYFYFSKDRNIPMTKNAIHVPVNAPKRDDTNLFIIFAVSQTSFF